jgi:hypothetical protein
LTTAVDDAAEGLEEFWNAMDLIENHEAILISLEEKLRVGELVAIGTQFEVQIKGAR